MQKILKQNLGLLIVSATTLLVAIWLYSQVLLPLASIGWDEGVHLLDAAAIASALRHGYLKTAVNISFDQYFYPPGYSWLVTFWSFIGGFSLRSFRLFSLVLWMGSAVFIYLITTNLLKHAWSIRDTTFAGLLAAFLFLTAPIFWIFGTEAMLEMTGGFFTLVTVWVLTWTTEPNDQPVRRSRWRRWLVVGISLTLLHFVKYNYAMWLLLAILADVLIATWVFGVKWLKTNLIGPAVVFYVFLLSFILWVLVPSRLSDYLYFFQDPNFYSYELVPLWQHLVWYFPITILSDYLASPWSSLLLLPGIYPVFKNFSNRSIRIIALAFLINLFFATLHLHNQQERYIFTTVPFLYILGAAGTVEIYNRLKAKLGAKVRPIKIITFIIFITFTTRDLVWNIGHIYGIAEHLLSSPVYASADYHDTAFNFDKSQWPSGSQLKQKPQDILFWVIDNSDAIKPLSYLGRSDEISPPALEYLRLVKRETGRSGLPHTTSWHEYALTLEVSPNSIINTYDYQKMNRASTEEGLKVISSDQSWQKLIEKEFLNLKVKTAIWGR